MKKHNLLELHKAKGFISGRSWVIAAIATSVLVYYFSGTIDRSNQIGDAVLAFTAIVLWWYTYETTALRKINSQMLTEAVKPHLKLQFKHSAIVRHQMPEEQRHPSHKLWTSVEILNEGQGVALELKISCSGRNGYSRNIKTLPAVRGNGGAAQIVYETEDKNDTTLNVYGKIIEMNIQIVIKYNDSLGNKYTVSFIADRHSADTFSIQQSV